MAGPASHALTPAAGPNWTALEAELRASRGDGVSVLKPQARFFTDPPTETNEAAIETVLGGQLYTVLGKPDERRPLAAAAVVEAVRDPDLARRRADRAWRRCLSLVGRALARGVAQGGALRMSRCAAASLPLVLLVLVVAALVWRLANPADTTVRSRLIGQAGARSSRCRRRSRQAGARRRPTFADGKPRLLNIFASWCVPCIAEAPVLMELKRRGVQHRRHRHPRPARGRRRLPRAATATRSSGSAPTRQSQVQLALGSSGVPESFVVDGRGVIRYQHIGADQAAATSPDDPAERGGSASESCCLLLLAVAASPRPRCADSSLPPADWADRQLPDRAPGSAGARR